MLFKNILVVDPITKLNERKDVLIKNGKIDKIKDDIDTNEEVINGENLVMAPSFFDTHVHFRDFNESHKDTFETGVMAALRGGYTGTVAMANTKPAMDRVERVREAKEKIKNLPIDIFLTATVTKDMKGEELVHFKELLDEGVRGFTEDGLPLKNIKLMEEALRYSKEYNFPISLHEEDPAFIEHSGYNHSAPREAEISLIDRDLKLQKEIGGIMNIQHLSSKEGVELIRKAKRENENLTCEVNPNHLFFTEEDVDKYKTLLKVNPPIRTEEDRLSLIEGLKNGTIDMISTDHAPHSKEDKERGMYESMSGIISLEIAFSISYMKLVKEGPLTIMELIEKLSTNPRKLYNIKSPISEGEDADLVILDLNKKYIYREAIGKAQNTPLIGKELQGKVLMTIYKGKVLYSNMKGITE